MKVVVTVMCFSTVFRGPITPRWTSEVDGEDRGRTERGL